MQNLKGYGYIRINSDKWDDLGKLWYVESFSKPDNSTGARLRLRDSFGHVEERVVPMNQIEWMSD